MVEKSFCEKQRNVRDRDGCLIVYTPSVSNK